MLTPLSTPGQNLPCPPTPTIRFSRFRCQVLARRKSLRPSMPVRSVPTAAIPPGGPCGPMRRERRGNPDDGNEGETSPGSLLATLPLVRQAHQLQRPVAVSMPARRPEALGPPGGRIKLCNDPVSSQITASRGRWDVELRQRCVAAGTARFGVWCKILERADPRSQDPPPESPALSFGTAAHAAELKICSRVLPREEQTSLVSGGRNR